jgi:N-acylneuraminate cytidylyltransferase/CMP-N,N'-diacetyllegionaminic acid synthase
MRVLFLITARGGSKGIPDKNLLLLGDRSLIAYKAISARKCRYCARLIVSSDTTAIQEEARRWGVEVPFTRPSALATDEAASEDVVLHAMDQVEAAGERYDAVMLLEPTSPFATHHDYARAVELMVERGANVVVGLRDVATSSVFQGPMTEDGRIPAIVDKLLGRGSVRRQDVDHEYTMNGAFYLLRWDFFRRTRRRYCDRDGTYGVVMPREYSVEIDEPLDYHFARFLVEQKHIDLSFWTEPGDEPGKEWRS